MNRLPSLRRAFGLLLLLGLFTGCPKPPVPDGLAGVPLAVDDPRAETVLTAHLDRVAGSHALRGEARVAFDGPEFKLNRPQRIAVARPGRLRFEVLGLFDVLAALLVSDGSEFGFFDAASGEITRGMISPELLFDLVHLDLEPQEVVSVLLAAPGPRTELVRSGVWLESDGGVSVAFSRSLSGRSSDRPSERDAGSDLVRQGGEIFRFDGRGLLREFRVVGPGLESRYRALYESYEPVEGSDPGLLFPMEMTLFSPAVESRATFRWKRVMLAAELSDRFFQIPDRGGAGR